MGRWDRELVELLPESVKVYASAGAGFDWIDTACLAEYGELDSRNQALGLTEPGKHWRVFREAAKVFLIGCKLSFQWERSCSFKSPAYSFDSGLSLAFIYSSCKPLMLSKELEFFFLKC